MPNPEFFSTLRNRPLNGSNKRFYMSRMSWQSNRLLKKASLDAVSRT